MRLEGPTLRSCLGAYLQFPNVYSRASLPLWSPPTCCGQKGVGGLLFGEHCGGWGFPSSRFPSLALGFPVLDNCLSWHLTWLQELSTREQGQPLGPCVSPTHCRALKHTHRHVCCHMYIKKMSCHIDTLYIVIHVTEI